MDPRCLILAAPLGTKPTRYKHTYKIEEDPRFQGFHHVTSFTRATPTQLTPTPYPALADTPRKREP